MTDTQQMVMFPPRSVAEFVEDLEKLKKEIQKIYCLDDIPWIIGVSWGKDSSAVVQLIWYAIAELPPEKRTKIIHVITTDTLVENPIVATWVNQSLSRLKQTAKKESMPFKTHLLKPEIAQTYWVGLIGKGYPAPRHTFRWCTPRLKIDPSNRFIRNVIRASGETIVVLGTRKTESANRASIMTKREVGRVRDRLSPHPSLPNSLIYTPIETWRTDEVWLYLMQWPNPWGGDNKDLLAMYRGATADNECPLVVDTSTPSCGSSRFGCWVCTLVESDKSLTAMIQNDEEKEWLQPLVDLRLELDVENDREKRDFRRIYGRVELFEKNLNGETVVNNIPGPYTKNWREHWLKRVLEAQTQIRKTAPPEMRDITLITHEELSEIRRIWLEEKHEFDDSLPRIYEEVTGEVFEDLRPGAERKLLGSDEWEALKEICEEDEMHLELMARLLDIERQHYSKPRRTGIYTHLDKCFDISSRDKEEAIDNAYYQYDVKKALQNVEENIAENVVKVKNALDGKEEEEENDIANEDNNESEQLSWESIKFGKFGK